MRLRCFFILIVLLNCTHIFSQSYSKTPLVSNLDWGVAFDIAPDGRIFTTQKGGFALQSVDAQIRVYDASGNYLSEFYDLSDSVDAGAESGLLGIALDPNFASNHFLYVYYTYNSDLVNSGDIRLRVQRFTDVNNTGTQPTLIMDLDVADTLWHNHVGGNIHFRPSDSTHLYVSIGDMGTGANGNAPALTDNPYGKILRISKYPGAAPPSDNPFYDDGDPYTGNCDWIWAYGLRNPFDFCFGPNDSLYATENGTTFYDEVNLITKGGFYGWPYCEGNYDGDTLTLPCHAQNAIDPLATFAFPLPALTGIIFYTDTTWSQQQNHLITGDFNHANLHDLTIGNAPAYDQVDSTQFWIDESMINGISCLREGAEGCIYVMEIGDSTYGGIYRICPDAVAVEESSYEPSLAITGENPFSHETTLTYTLPHSQEVSVIIYDCHGRTVAEIANEYQTQGEHSIGLNTDRYNLIPGVYNCVLFTASGSTSLPLIVY